MIKQYRSRDGKSYFKFAFVPQGDQIAIICLAHPSLNGQDPSPNLTHLFTDGRLCFVSGREPTTQERAEELAVMWAEYFCTYRQTGIPQS